jgi:hypothetical protein
MSEDSENDDSSERSLSSGEQYFPEESTMILDCGGTGVREVNNYAGHPMKSPGKAIGDSLVLRKLEIILSLSDEGGKYIGVDELFHGISRNPSKGWGSRRMMRSNLSQIYFKLSFHSLSTMKKSTALISTNPDLGHLIPWLWPYPHARTIN